MFLTVEAWEIVVLKPYLIQRFPFPNRRAIFVAHFDNKTRHPAVRSGAGRGEKDHLIRVRS